MLLAILGTILTWLTIGVPIALLVLWDRLAAWWRGRAAADSAIAEEDPADWRTWPAMWERE